MLENYKLDKKSILNLFIIFSFIFTWLSISTSAHDILIIFDKEILSKNEIINFFIIFINISCIIIINIWR